MDKADKSRILIVDDIDENLKVLTDTLVQDGYHPLQAKSGERAIQIAQVALPDLILLDIRMPGMDGFQTIAALKADERTRNIPVIFISALNQVEDKVQGFAAGAVDYVSKPFQREEVLARVGTHLKLRMAQRQVEEERRKSDQLLLTMLPAQVAEELKEKGRSEPQSFAATTILFSDIAGFTAAAAELEPAELIAELNELFTAFDTVMEKHRCERIKTIGDAYFAVAGIPEPLADHAFAMVSAARDMLAYLDERRRSDKRSWSVRIGIHSGPAVAGIVGTRKYLYDVFGDTVNTASRMESLSEAGRITLSGATAALLDGRVPLEKRPPAEVKGKGSMATYFVARS